MPRNVTVTFDDGTSHVYQGVPDNATPDQVQVRASQEFAGKTLTHIDGGANTDTGGTTFQNLAAGAGKVVYDVGRGARQIASSIPLVNKLDFFNPQTVQADTEEAKRRDAPLMATKAGQIGNVIGNVAMTAAIPGAGTLGGSVATGAVLSGLQPTTGDESRLTNTAIGAAGGAVGKVVGDKIAGAVASRLGSSETQAGVAEAQNAVRDAALKAGQEAGYAVPPVTVNPSLPNKVVGSAGGKAAFGQQASLNNQVVTDSLARKALGLNDTAPLTPDALRTMRLNEGQAYQAVKDFGSSVNLKLKPDGQFQQDIAAIGGDIANAQKTMPNIFKSGDIDAIKSDLNQNLTPANIITAVQKLRSDATANFKSFDSPEKLGLARAQRNAADALDGLLERNLPADMSQAYQAARVNIAKIHDVEAALSGGGHVDARVLANMGDKVTGELKTIADFAANFPKAVQLPEKIGGAGVTALGFGLGSSLGYSEGGGEGAGLGGIAGVLAPGAVRGLMLSRLGQSLAANPSYAVNPLLRYGAPTTNALAKYLPPALGASYVGEQ